MWRRTVVLGLSLHFIACSGSEREFGKPTESGGTAGDATGGPGGGAGQQGGTSAQGGTHSAGAGGDVTAGASGGGSAGASGLGGNAAECSTDAECDNGVACDGRETCVANSCQAGQAPCANPDEAHCEVICEEPGANGQDAVCVVRGTDKDNDQHRSSLCPIGAGDDCDDESETTFTGAQELCDGLDNDCDGKYDLQDGLALSGADQVIAPGTSDFYGYTSPFQLVWAPEQQIFGVAWAAGFKAYFGTVDKTGKKLVEPTSIGMSSVGRVNLAWSGRNFGLGWGWHAPTTTPDTPQDFIVRPFSPDVIKGIDVNLTQGKSSVAVPLALLSQPNAFVGVWAGSDPAQPVRARSSPITSGLRPIIEFFPSSVPSLKIASRPNRIAMVWGDEKVIKKSIRNGVLAPITDDAFPAAGGRGSDAAPLIAATPSGFAVSWVRDPDTADEKDELLMYAEIDDLGAITCGPISMPWGLADGPTLIAAGPKQTVLVYNTNVIIQAVRGCKALIRGTPLEEMRVAAIASADESGFGLIWRNQFSAADQNIRARVVGPQLCD